VLLNNPIGEAAINSIGELQRRPMSKRAYTHDVFWFNAAEKRCSCRKVSLRSTPECWAFYDRKRAEGKRHIQALVALAGEATSCGRCCATGPPSRPRLQLDIFIGTPYDLELNWHLGRTAASHFQRPRRGGRLVDAEPYRRALGRQAGTRCLTSSGSPPLVPVRGDLEVHLWRRC
jgi:hypothetical protein